MTRLADFRRTAMSAAQTLTVFAMCIGACLALPIGLFTVGFPSV